MNDCITTTKQSTTKPCAYFLGCTVTSRIGITARVCKYTTLFNMDLITDPCPNLDVGSANLYKMWFSTLNANLICYFFLKAITKSGWNTYKLWKTNYFSPPKRTREIRTQILTNRTLTLQPAWSAARKLMTPNIRCCHQSISSSLISNNDWIYFVIEYIS